VTCDDATLAKQLRAVRRASEVFELEVPGLRYTATVSRFSDGRIRELFLNNHKSNSGQHKRVRYSDRVQLRCPAGADANAIRRALSRDSQGPASGPLGGALDLLLENET
jgi:hypothetical protein